MIAAIVVQEGKFLFECGWPAAGPVADLVVKALPLEDGPLYVFHANVVIVPVSCARAAAVVQQQCLIAVVTETQLTHSQLHLTQGAEVLPPGSLSPPGLVSTQAPAPPLLPVEQRPDHMLKLALCEALEHGGN